jgi:hypothetical protein
MILLEFGVKTFKDRRGNTTSTLMVTLHPRTIKRFSKAWADKPLDHRFAVAGLLSKTP